MHSGVVYIVSEPVRKVFHEIIDRWFTVGRCRNALTE